MQGDKHVNRGKMYFHHYAAHAAPRVPLPQISESMNTTALTKPWQTLSHGVFS